MTEKKAVDLGRGQEVFLDLVMAGIPSVELLNKAARGEGEKSIVALLKWALQVPGMWGKFMRGLPVAEEDTIIFDYRVAVGIADLVIFHLDGTATVVEIKDGRQGFRSVAGGLGQAGLYAVQLDPSKALRGVRRALAWTCVETPSGSDKAINDMCLEAGAVPIFLPKLQDLVRVILRQSIDSTMEAVHEFMKERA